MNLKIRTASENDINFIMEIEKCGFIPQIQEKEEVFLKRIKINPQLFLIFQIDEKIAGYLSAEYFSKIPTSEEELSLGHFPSAAAEKNYIYISSFSILPEFRGNGNGKLCWNKALEFLGKENKFILLVNEAWKGAKHIYKESNFKEIKTFKNFFPTESGSFTDGTLMVKI